MQRWIQDQIHLAGTFFLYSSSSPLSQLVPPPFYVFEGDALHVRDSGVPELKPPMRASFQTEPDWLDDKDPFVLNGEQVPYGPDQVIEMKDGFKLTESRRCYIDYLQLPEGVALPCVDEVDSS